MQALAAGLLPADAGKLDVLVAACYLPCQLLCLMVVEKNAFSFGIVWQVPHVEIGSRQSDVLTGCCCDQVVDPLLLPRP